MDTSLFDWIREEAEYYGVPVTKMLALSPKNDPFYQGTPTDQMMAGWFRAIWDRAGYTMGVHLRRAHYWAVSKQVVMHNGKPYENTIACWQYLTQAAKMARYMGIVPIEAIIDNKNPEPVVNAYYWGHDAFTFEVNMPADPFKPDIHIYGPHAAEVQQYHLEIWIEKGTMNDVLIPLCRRFHINLCSFQGEASITSVYNCARRIEQSGKPTIIYYIADFDPAGKSMPVAVARKLEYMLRRYEIDNRVYVRSIALNEDQVASYALPRVPIKETEKRKGRFESDLGTGGVELDALEAIYPGTLASILRDAIEEVFDYEAEDRYTTVYNELQDRVDREIALLVERFRPELEAAEEALRALQTLEFDTDEYTPEKVEDEGYLDDDGCLFSTDREYRDQIDAYNAHKGRSNDDE